MQGLLHLEQMTVSVAKKKGKERGPSFGQPKPASTNPDGVGNQGERRI